MTSEGKVWFITGTTTGLGREWATAALDRGDRVAATARNPDRIKDLVETYGNLVLPIQLDVTDRAAVFDAVSQAHDHFGRLDVVVNNAGYGTYGMIEELSEQEARAQLDTNLFGAIWVSQAALPFLRDQGAGHILQVSSVGGLMAGPSLGIYYASKWALEGISEALSQEVRDFGIRVTIVEPTGFATAGEASARHATPLPAYERQHERFAAMQASMAGNQGDPRATRDPILAVVDAENPPLRILLGAGIIERVASLYESRLATWREWEPVSVAAHGTRAE